MTNKQLNRLYWLNRDIERIEARIDELANPSRAMLTGMPRGGGISDSTGRAAIKISAMRLRLEAARIEAVEELFGLTQYIEGIDDPLMRQIMQYRHIDGLPWEQVAACIGGGMTGESCRKAHYRYLNNA